MSEWIRLTPEGTEPVKHCRVELVGNQHGCWYEHLFTREFDSEVKYAALSLSTQELANIPWVRALVETARKAQEHLQQESDTGGSVGDAINAQKLHVALEPFAEVTYE